MRNEIEMLNSFMPKHEKEWEAHLFVDKAIKNSIEYHLEAMARALSGNRDIKLRMAEQNKPFVKTEHIKGDNANWIEKTDTFRWEARMDAYVFNGQNKIQIWLKIIDFWAGTQSIWPCGGAGFIKSKEAQKGE